MLENAINCSALVGDAAKANLRLPLANQHHLQRREHPGVVYYGYTTVTHNVYLLDLLSFIT